METIIEHTLPVAPLRGVTRLWVLRLECVPHPAGSRLPCPPSGPESLLTDRAETLAAGPKEEAWEGLAGSTGCVPHSTDGRHGRGLRLPQVTRPPGSRSSSMWALNSSASALVLAPGGGTTPALCLPRAPRAQAPGAGCPGGCPGDAQMLKKLISNLGTWEARRPAEGGPGIGGLGAWLWASIVGLACRPPGQQQLPPQGMCTEGAQLPGLPH